MPARVGYLSASLSFFLDSEITMASNTAVTEKRRARTHKNAGRKRKRTESKKSTPSASELFAGLGDPGVGSKK